MKFSLPKKILIATNNKGKFFEIESLLKTINIESISTFDFNLVEPEETGKTFKENSLLKAKFYSQKTGLASLADDSGLCVEAMNGEPGIHSARFAIDELGNKNFPLAFEKIEKEIIKTRDPSTALGALATGNSRAYFICNLSLFDPQTNFEISFEGRVDGNLTFPPRGNKGFGYDPIFIKNGMDKTFGEIMPEEKDKISHRSDAFEQLVSWLKNRDL
jgi:XTP/dITP diphosphohydrolase